MTLETLNGKIEVSRYPENIGKDIEIMFDSDKEDMLIWSIIKIREETKEEVRQLAYRAIFYGIE